MVSHVKYFFAILSLLLLAPPAFSVDQPTDGAPVPGPTQPTAATPVTKPSKSVEDYTDKLQLIPGVVITFPIVEGIDTRRKKLGDYDFTANIQDANADGFAYKWTMSKPAEAHGLRAVAPEDEKDSALVSLFYQDGQSLTMSGYTNAVRVSDSLYKGLKSGRTLPFQIDLEDKKDVPSKIRMVGREYVGIFVDGKKARVRAIKAETDNRWHYWIMDKADFPIMVQGDGPFKWHDPQFNLTDAESRRVIKDLEKNGVATTYAILFAFNSAKLENSSKQILNGIATYLKKTTDMNLAVEGHCDIVGRQDYNMLLSQKRANAVRDYLVSKGVAKSRLEPKGYGYSQPIADNITAAGRAKNRRVVFRKI
jgi:outer membrane protein OmpA-like peptidoglycan-associated protein